jgi:hypothetical protein
VANPSSAASLRAVEAAFRRGLPAPPEGTTLDARGNFWFRDRAGHAFDSHMQASLRRAFEGRDDASAADRRRLETLSTFGSPLQGIPRAILTRDGWEPIRVLSAEDADRLRDYAEAVERRDAQALARFRGETISDIYGKKHRLITDQRILAQLDRADELKPPPRAFGRSP